MRDQLASWLEVDDVDIAQISGGASNLTYRIVAGQNDWILRRPPAFTTATSNDMRREWTVLQALAGTDVPVPRVVRTFEDESVIGVPFYLMERLDGIVFRAAADVGHLDEESSRLCTNALVDVLARIHSVDPAAVGLESFGRPQGFLARQVGRWRKQWELTKFAEVPEIDEALRRLESTLPSHSDASIVHGDYSFNNTMFCREPVSQMQAVLDWEMSTLGDPLTDLGMLLLYWGPTSKEIWTGVPAHRANPGFGTPDDVLRRYAATSGRDVEGIDFYITLATLKMAVIMAGARRRIGDTDPQRAAAAEDKTKRLAAIACEAAGQLRP